MIEQQRIKQNSFFIKVMLLGGFLLSLFVSGPARAQTVNDWIASLGSIGFTQGGAAQIPTGVLQSLQNGSVSPVMQYVLLNSTLNQAIQQSLSQTPDARLPYTAALEKYNWGICNIQKSFQTNMLLVMLPKSSQVTQNGGSSSDQVRATYLAIALSMAQRYLDPSHPENKGCDPNNSSDLGFDSNILQFLQSL